MSDTPIYTQLLRELYAERCRHAHEMSPGLIGCQWCAIPEDLPPAPPRYDRRRRTR